MNEPRTSRAPLIAGFLAAGFGLIALGMCTSALQRRESTTADAPPLELLSPQTGDTLTDSLVIRFRTRAPLALASHGWSAGDLHPHILLDGTEHMAAAPDIRAEGDVFSWKLPAPAAGEHALLLTWAGMHHGTVGDTTGRTVRFHFRGPIAAGAPDGS